VGLSVLVVYRRPVYSARTVIDHANAKNLPDRRIAQASEGMRPRAQPSARPPSRAGRRHGRSATPTAAAGCACTGCAPARVPS
jgi:hypothetical protein